MNRTHLSLLSTERTPAKNSAARVKKMVFSLLSLLLAHTSLAQNGAAVVSVNAPTSVAPGASFIASITMTNTGGSSWTTAGLFNLGSESPRNNLTWGTGRIALPRDPINPGETASFTNTFTAPTVPGLYNFSWGMVQDTVEWFGQIASQNIKVGNGQFTPGDLVVMQMVATASDPISANGTAIVLKSISPLSGATTFEVDLPFTGLNGIVSGSSAFTGMIDLSTDKKYIVVGGYNTNLPSSLNVESANPSIVPRAIGTVNSSGQYVLGATATTTNATGPTPRALRGSISDGLGNFWGGGVNSAGIYYYGTNFPPVQISNLDPNGVGGTGVGAIRDLIMVNGKPNFSSSQYPTSGNHGISTFTNAAPTTPQNPIFVLDAGNTVTGKTGTPSIKGFCFNTNLTIAYLVDLRAAPDGGIFRYNGNGSGTNGSWTYAYTITNSVYAGGSFQEIVADFSGANPIIYATAGPGNGNSQGASAGTNLVTAVDTGIPDPTFTSLATSPLTAPFRGLTFAPKAATTTPVILSISRSGSNVIISWNGGGFLQSANVITGTFGDVSGSPTSPYTNSPSGNKFYRVRIP